MVLVVGLDGATFDLLDPWIDQGYLPTLARLIAAGSRAPLESTLPPVTAAAWASFMTGKHPAKHGVFDFFRGRAGRVNLVDATCIEGSTLWGLLSAAGRRVGVLNVPVTYPPQPVNGYLVPGLLSPDQGRTTYPPDFLAAYRAELGPYRLTPTVPYRPGNEEAFIADLHHVLATQSQYAQRLVQENPVDFLMVHFLVTDIAQHALWRHLDPAHPWHDPILAQRYGNAVRDIFVQADVAIGQLIDLLPDDATNFVMSDHGFGPVNQTVSLNVHLLEQGLLALKRTSGVRARWWALQHRLSRAAGMRMGRWLGREHLMDYDDVNWSHTVAYAMGHMGQVYLNLKGREPEGVVAAAEYLTVRGQVAAALASMKDLQTGRPLVDAVLPSEAAGHGPYRLRGPDLHIVLVGGLSAHPLFAASGGVLSEQRHFSSGDHRRLGILIAAGPGIRAQAPLNGARIIDLAPTLLHLLGVPAPEDMDGRVLAELVTEAPISEAAPTTAAAPMGAALTPEEQDVVAAQLRGLGYLR